jgi:hypothetical protein
VQRPIELESSLNIGLGIRQIELPSCCAGALFCVTAQSAVELKGPSYTTFLEKFALWQFNELAETTSIAINFKRL